MQTSMIRALCRPSKLFKGAPISFSQQFSSYHHNHMFSTGEDDIQQGYREDMVESYGLAYATRCSDEGYGERYGESVREKVDKEDMKVSLGLAHATRFFGKGNKEGYEESITLSNQHVGGEDMTKSFGLAYATRCSDEGYGDRYGESVEVGGKCGEGIEVLGKQNLEEKDMGKSFGLAFPRECFDTDYNGRHGDQKVDEEDMTESFGLAYATRAIFECNSLAMQVGSHNEQVSGPPVDQQPSTHTMLKIGLSSNSDS
ncbi:hypothetical protein SUGI_0093120 [Cryptomeria japonica]|nr:hypothetical protein SUGI_0093120 [Cryptomeria japonica]